MAVLCEEHNSKWGICKTIPVTCSECIRGELEERIERVIRMCNAYPLDIFPEYDHKKAREVLKQHGMTIDQVSASMARHVLKRVPSILRGEGE